MARKSKKQPGVAPLALDLSCALAVPVFPCRTRKLRIILAGCGGTGSWLAPHVARIASEVRQQWQRVELVFVDPDVVEDKNIPRQNFVQAELGLDKACALAQRYAVWGVEIQAVPNRYDPKLASSWDTLTVVIGCVDNAAARQSIARSLDRCGSAPAVWWLDCGNARESGQVLFGSANEAGALKEAFKLESCCTALPSPALVQPRLLEPLPEETAGHTLSCAELAAANAQSLTVNNAIACIASDYLVRFLFGELRRFATYIDLGSGSVRSEYITPECVAAAVGQSPARLFAGHKRNK